MTDNRSLPVCLRWRLWGLEFRGARAVPRDTAPGGWAWEGLGFAFGPASCKDRYVPMPVRYWRDGVEEVPVGRGGVEWAAGPASGSLTVR